MLASWNSIYSLFIFHLQHSVKALSKGSMCWSSIKAWGH